MSDAVLLEVNGARATVTLNRPDSYNAASSELHHALTSVWAQINHNPAVKAAVLTGAGKAFCAGGDLLLLERMCDDLDERRRVMNEAGQLVREILSVRVPIVAAVNGAAVGLGCSLASLCDLVVMDESAYFADPHVMLGLVGADGGALTFPFSMSLQQAKEILLLGDRVSAADALRLGMANRVVERGTALAEATALADRLAALPPQATQQTKRVVNGALMSRIAEALDAALAAETESFDRPEFRANLGAMVAKLHVARS